MPDIRLDINGKSYGGWTRLRASVGVTQLAGSYELEVSERWSGQAQPWKILPGDRATLLLDGEAIITGFVDVAEPQYDATSHGVSITGRDVTGDLVDCSVPLSPVQWSGYTIDRLAAELCKPYNIAVTVTADVGAPFKALHSNPGESVFELLDRAARIVGLLLISDGRGGLVIAQPSSTRIKSALKLGSNLVSARATHSWQDRYSEYSVLGQSADQLAGDAADFDVRGTATDPNISRPRPLVVIAEDGVDAARAQQRAQWEAQVRAARGTSMTASVRGWSHADGIWRADRVVSVDDAYNRISGDLYIEQCTYLLDERGARTELRLVGAGAYTRLAVPETERGGW